MNTIKSMKLKIEQLESQNKVLLNMYENVRDFKHDYGNFIQILDGYSKMNSMDGVKKLCNRAKLGYKDINNMGMLTPEFINNPMLYNILVSKFFTAREHGITINFESMIDFESVKEKICWEEFLYIFSELLNNAIDLAKLSEKKEINIGFSEDLKQRCVYAIIENSYKDKKFGVKNMKKGIKCPENIELFISKGEMFIQELKIL